MKNALTLATAGLRPGQLDDINYVQYPRVDYIELQRILDTDILDYSAYDDTRLGTALRYLETQLRSDPYLALLSILKNQNHRVIFAMSERVGIPLAGLRRLFPKNPPLVSMFQCWSARQEIAITTFNLFAQMDAIIVHCNSMKRHFIELGVPKEKISVIHYSVDQNFFVPAHGVAQSPNRVLTLGETRSRDYATLFKAINGLPVELLALPSGRWYARQKQIKTRAIIPQNVTFSGNVSLLDLKNFYSQVQFVVLPLYDQVFSAGSTVALETACMGRAIIATRSRGILDYIIDGETGILVDPGDEKAMRAAVEDLLAHPEKARRLGENARQRINQELNLDNYIENIAQLLGTYL
jgi:glycosyltransferase involved in cell wall biosynthesis